MNATRSPTSVLMPDATLTVTFRAPACRRALTREATSSASMRSRLAAGLTQVECAHRFGAPRASNWCNWETGDTYPDPAVMVAFCDGVGTTMDWLYRGVRPMVAPAPAAPVVVG